MLCFVSRTENGIQTAALSAKLVELATLLAERDAKLTELSEFVKNRSL